MNVTITIEGLDAALQALQGFSDRRMRAAIATSMTRTVGDIAALERSEMDRSLDRPTPYTRGSVGTKSATAESLTAEVFIKDQQGGRGGRPAAVYLQAQVLGGTRRTKAFESLLQQHGLMPPGWRAVPGAGARLDAYGNIDAKQLGEIIKQLAGIVSTGAARKAGGRFFVVQPGKRGIGPGIYAREFGGRNITPVIVYVSAVRYRMRYDFFGIAERAAGQRFMPQLERALDDSLARLQGRGG